MSGYVDIHAHILPGIDDGPVDLAGAVEMAYAAAQAGTWTIAATPHLRSDFPLVDVQEIAERCEEVRAAVESESIPVRIVPAAEVSLVWALEADEDDLRRASYDQRGQDLLIETPTAGVVGLPTHLWDIRRQGYRVTLAHPERNVEFQRDDEPLRELAEQGIVLQVNSESLTAPRSARHRKLAETLCREGLAQVLASDGHRASSWRPVTQLARGVEAAAALVGPDRAEWMAREAPQAVVEGRELADGPELVLPRRRRWFGRG